jgi:hypothetical protein
MTFIYQPVDTSTFVRAFDEADRSENFSRPARVALFDYLTEQAEGTGSPIQLDVIALCCEWHELTADEIRAEYDMEPEQLHDETTVIEVTPWDGEPTYLLLAF